MKKYAPIILILSTIAMLCLFIGADRGSLPHFIRNIYDFPFGDKIGHLLLIGGFAWIVQYSLISLRKNPHTIRRIIFLTAIGIAALITVEELTQIFIAGRTFSWIDLFFSYTGIGLFSLVHLRMQRMPK